MIERIIFFGAIAIAVSITLGYLQNRTGDKVPSINGQFLLRMNKLYSYLGIFSFVLGLFLTVMIVVTDTPFLIAILMLLIFWGAGIPCFIYYRNHSLKFNDMTIEVKDFYGRTNSIAWSEISNISFNHLFGLLTVVNDKGIKVKIHQHIVGLSSFIKLMEEKTTWKAKQLRIPLQKSTN